MYRRKHIVRAAARRNVGRYQFTDTANRSATVAGDARTAAANLHATAATASSVPAAFCADT